MPRLTSLALAALSLVAPALAACDYGTHLNPRSEGAVPISTFGYTALDGPLNWHGLNATANALCATGKHQSPINIDSSIQRIEGRSVEFVVDAYPYGAEFENLGTTVEVPVNGTLWADGKMYKLAQFHFHSTSEHRVEQEYFPMETHFVFSAPGESSTTTSTRFSLRHLVHMQPYGIYIYYYVLYMFGY
jgi:carbonic anhydrase